jgi:hypothetical protein
MDFPRLGLNDTYRRNSRGRPRCHHHQCTPIRCLNGMICSIHVARDYSVHVARYMASNKIVLLDHDPQPSLTRERRHLSPYTSTH